MTDDRIVAVETLRHPAHPEVLHVRLHSETGRVGLGETYHRAAAVNELVHGELAPLLLGAPATNIAELWRRVGSPHDGGQPYTGAATVESSATSALDIALWDLRARALDLPLCEAVGGRLRDRIRVYVTAVDAAQGSWALGGDDGGRFRDWTASFERPAELARELVASGVTALKLWPFAPAAEATRGLSITARQIEQAIAPLRAIRDAVGGDLDLAVDLACGWSLAPALRIARALEPFDLLWLEDPTRLNALDALARVAAATRTPVAGNDYRAGLASYLDLLEAGGVAVVRLDVQWAGGVSEALRIAGAAEARGRGVVLHDCAGPVQWATAVHLALHLRNAMIQECVRAYAHVIYPTMATGVPSLEDGHARPAEAPGHGVELADALVSAARRERSTLDAAGVKRSIERG